MVCRDYPAAAGLGSQAFNRRSQFAHISRPGVMTEQFKSFFMKFDERVIVPDKNWGSVAKNIFTTFYSGNTPAIATISCVASEFLQQSRFFSSHLESLSVIAIFCPDISFRQTCSASRIIWAKLGEDAS